MTQTAAYVWMNSVKPLLWVMACCTHQWEIHDLYDPDSEGQVNYHGGQKQQQKEIEASFPPAVQTHWVHGITARPLEVQGLGGEDKLLLGNLENKQTHRSLYAGWLGGIILNPLKKLNRAEAWLCYSKMCDNKKWECGKNASWCPQVF